MQEQDLRHRCSVCGAPTKMRCTVCKAVYYCGRKCQIGDKTRHKTTCSPPLPATIEFTFGHNGFDAAGLPNNILLLGPYATALKKSRKGYGGFMSYRTSLQMLGTFMVAEYSTFSTLFHGEPLYSGDDNTFHASELSKDHVQAFVDSLVALDGTPIASSGAELSKLCDDDHELAYFEKAVYLEEPPSGKYEHTTGRVIYDRIGAGFRLYTNDKLIPFGRVYLATRTDRLSAATHRVYMTRFDILLVERRALTFANYEAPALVASLSLWMERVTGDASPRVAHAQDRERALLRGLHDASGAPCHALPHAREGDRERVPAASAVHLLAHVHIAADVHGQIQR